MNRAMVKCQFFAASSSFFSRKNSSSRTFPMPPTAVPFSRTPGMTVSFPPRQKELLRQGRQPLQKYPENFTVLYISASLIYAYNNATATLLPFERFLREFPNDTQIYSAAAIPHLLQKQSGHPSRFFHAHWFVTPAAFCICGKDAWFRCISFSIFIFLNLAEINPRFLMVSDTSVNT